MARGGAQTQRKQRPKPAPKRKRSAPTYEQAMFFPRLRRQAKWVFVFLALVFAVGFVAFGVGSGSNGLSDVLNGQFFGGGGSGTSSQIKDDQKKIARNPNDIQAYLQLANLLQQDNKEAEAVGTLNRAAKVAPKNADVLNTLAGIYSNRAQRAIGTYQNAALALANANLLPPGVDSSSTLGQALSQDPLTQSLTNTKNEAYTKAITAINTAKTAYKRVATATRGTSAEAAAQLALGGFAKNAGDTATAIAAYKRYLRLDPNGTYAAAVR